MHEPTGRYEIRCPGTFRGKRCGKLLAEAATAGYQATCERCKSTVVLIGSGVAVIGTKQEPFDEGGETNGG